jgi:hypothetical protein
MVSTLQTAVSDWEEIICTGSHFARKCTEMHVIIIIQCPQTALHSDISTLDSGTRSSFLATVISRPQYNLLFLLEQYEIIGICYQMSNTRRSENVFENIWGVSGFSIMCVRALRRPVETSVEKKHFELYIHFPYFFCK